MIENLPDKPEPERYGEITIHLAILERQGKKQKKGTGYNNSFGSGPRKGQSPILAVLEDGRIVKRQERDRDKKRQERDRDRQERQERDRLQ